MRRDTATALHRLECLTQGPPIVVRPLPCALAGREHCIGLSRNRLNTTSQQHIDHELRQSEKPEAARCFRVRLSVQSLLLEVDQCARHRQSRLLAEVNILPAQSECFRDPQPGPEHHIDYIQQFAAPARSSVASPFLPFAQPFTKSTDLINREGLNRPPRLR